MQRSDFNYHLPTQLIAQQPLADRSASRLLSLNGQTGAYHDHCFRDIIDLIDSHDLLVFNNTQVIPARLYGYKDSGGKVEVLIERLLDEHQALVHIRASRAPKAGQTLILEDAVHAKVLRREDSLFVLIFQHQDSLLSLLNEYGHIPLPPYIERAQGDDEQEDRQRYQTVFAQKPGAVAAPTAGLHFDQDILQQLKAKGVQQQAITLHVGAGTFQPVRVDNLAEHTMHSEWIEVSEEACAAITACRERGGRVIAVGTTSVRSLESAAQSGKLKAFSGDTRLFITPGYRFQVVDAMITNFHLPESTLLMLVSAFSGYEPIMRAYQHAIEAEYRFFSYGDAMFLTPSPDARP